MTGNTAWHKWGVRLAASEERQFERACLPFLRLLWPELVITAPRGKWDRQGIDLVAYGDRDEIECVVQCKTSQLKLLGADEIREATKSIAAFESSPHSCRRYLFVINGDGRSAEFSRQVASRLEKLVVSGKAASAELWDRQQLLNHSFVRMKEILLAGLQEQSDARRDAFRRLFQFGSVYLPETPVKEEKLVLKLGERCQRVSVCGTTNRNLARMLIDDSRARWTLVTGLFGAGKTTAALEAAGTGEHTAIFVSAADLSEGATRMGTNALAQEVVSALGLFQHGAPPIDGFSVIDDSDEEIFTRLAGAALSSILRSEESDHILILDGLDENRVYLSPNGLQVLNNELADLKCPIVLTTRFEHLSTMFGNFEALLDDLGKKRRSSQPARLLTLAPWSMAEVRAFVEIARQSATIDEKAALDSFLQAVNSGSIYDYYGDLPLHPLFLQLILDDLCVSGLHVRSRPELVERWIRLKTWRDMDHHGIPPEHATDRNEWLDDMLTLTEAISVAMTTGGERIELVENIDSALVESIAAHTLGKSLRITTIVLYTVLVPRGFRLGKGVEVRFALRIAQEYFLARHLARTGASVGAYPAAVRKLVSEIKGD